MIEKRYTCTCCGWTALPEDWPSKCSMMGTREEPPEWEAWCGKCGASWLESEEESEEEYDID